MIREIVTRTARRSRARRADLFRYFLKPTDKDRILDLGGGDGSHFAGIVPYREKVCVADIDLGELARGGDQFGFETVLLDAGGVLPFADKSFDIVFCSSMIEHVTVNKDDVMRIRTNHAFSQAATQSQQLLASEIRRIGVRYFVQTPHKFFPLESHTWLPLVIVLAPRAWQISLIRFMNKWWVKKTSPDWHLLTMGDMRNLFPDAEILVERMLGLAKSMIAVGR